MNHAAAALACGLVVAAWAAAALPQQPAPPVRFHPGSGHDEAAAAGWIATDFSGPGVALEVRSAPGTVTDYGTVFSIMNHADVPVTFCLAGTLAGPPVWTLHAQGLHWQSGQAGASLVTLEAHEEREVELRFDWRDASADAVRISWSIIPLGEPGCDILP